MSLQKKSAPARTGNGSKHLRDSKHLHCNNSVPNATKKIELVTLKACPRAECCNANICPFDREYLNRSHHRSEPLCQYFREDAKRMHTGKFDGVMFVIYGLPISIHAFRTKTRYAALKCDLGKIGNRHSPEVTT